MAPPTPIILRPGALHAELTPEEIDEDYERNTGKVILETFARRGIDPVHVPAVLCASHGPFTWGKDAAEAVYHAAVLEGVAKMAVLTLTIDPAPSLRPNMYWTSILCASTDPMRIMDRKNKAYPWGRCSHCGPAGAPAITTTI